MPSLRLDVGWKGLGQQKAEKKCHFLTDVKAVMHSVLDLRQGRLEHRETARASQRDRLQDMLDRTEENMQKAHALMSGWQLPSILGAGGSAQTGDATGASTDTASPNTATELDDTPPKTANTHAQTGQRTIASPNITHSTTHGHGHSNHHHHHHLHEHLGNAEVAVFTQNQYSDSTHHVQHIPRKHSPLAAQRAREHQEQYERKHKDEFDGSHVYRGTAQRYARSYEREHRQDTRVSPAPFVPLTMKALEASSPKIIIPRVKPSSDTGHGSSHSRRTFQPMHQRPPMPETSLVRHIYSAPVAIWLPRATFQVSRA